MNFKIGVFIIALSMVALSVFGKDDEVNLSSTQMIMTKAEASAYWNSVAAE